MRMLIVAAIFVAVLLPFFLLRSGAKGKEVAFSALGFFAAAFPIAVLFALGSPGLGGGPEADLVTLAGLTLVFYVFSITFFPLALRRTNIPCPASVQSCPLVVLRCSGRRDRRIGGRDDSSGCRWCRRPNSVPFTVRRGWSAVRVCVLGDLAEGRHRGGTREC